MKNKDVFKFKPILEGRKVSLRPFREEDSKIMLEILSEFEVKKLTGSARDDLQAKKEYNELEKESIKNWYLTRNNYFDRLDLAIIDKSNGNLVGEVAFNEYKIEDKSVSFRVLIGEEGRDRGLGSEAISIFLEYGFEEIELNRVELEVYSFNPRAEHVYKKLGFKLIELVTDEFSYNGQFVDIGVYELLRIDYEKGNL